MTCSRLTGPHQTRLVRKFPPCTHDPAERTANAVPRRRHASLCALPSHETLGGTEHHDVAIHEPGVAVRSATASAAAVLATDAQLHETLAGMERRVTIGLAALREVPLPTPAQRA